MHSSKIWNLSEKQRKMAFSKARLCSLFIKIECSFSANIIEKMTMTTLPIIFSVLSLPIFEFGTMKTRIKSMFPIKSTSTVDICL